MFIYLAPLNHDISNKNVLFQHERHWLKIEYTKTKKKVFLFLIVWCTLLTSREASHGIAHQINVKSGDFLRDLMDSYIAFDVHTLNQFMHKPGIDMVYLVKLSYLGRGVLLTLTSKAVLCGQSTIGFCVHYY